MQRQWVWQRKHGLSFARQGRAQAPRRLEVSRNAEILSVLLGTEGHKGLPLSFLMTRGKLADGVIQVLLLAVQL